MVTAMFLALGGVGKALAAEPSINICQSVPTDRRRLRRT
jgi:hypothetical protein